MKSWMGPWRKMLTVQKVQKAQNSRQRVLKNSPKLTLDLKFIVKINNQF